MFGLTLYIRHSLLLTLYNVTLLTRKVVKPGRSKHTYCSAVCTVSLLWQRLAVKHTSVHQEPFPVTRPTGRPPATPKFANRFYVAFHKLSQKNDALVVMHVLHHFPQSAKLLQWFCCFFSLCIKRCCVSAFCENSCRSSSISFIH